MINLTTRSVPVVNAQDSTLIVYILEVEGVEKHTQYATWFTITKHRS